MDFKALEAFVKTIELSSFSKASEAMYLSQPSISGYVSGLESELGTKLISRTTKDVRPTKEGQLLYEYARSIIALKEKAVFAVKSRADSPSGQIDICASNVPGQYLLPEILADFNRSYPNISFRVDVSDTDNVIKSLLLERCELGMVGAQYDDGNCDYRYILSEGLVLIMSPDSKLTEISLLRDIYAESFLVREEGSATRRHAWQSLRKMNLDPEKLNIAAQFSTTQGIISAVSKGFGVSVVSEIAAREYIRAGLVRAIGLEGCSRSFYFAWRKDAVLQPQTMLFMDYVCDLHVFSQNPGDTVKERENG